jgi:tRNA pseudouridine38-40 synthase
VLRLAADPPLTCAGRTDAGVHAWCQEVHVDLPTEPDVDGLQRRLIKMLAPAIVVRAIRIVPTDWDARHSAIWRLYRYTVLNRPVPDPFLAGRTWWVASPLDRRAMELACDAVIGEHDFSSFCRAGATPAVRRVLDAGWNDLGEGVLRLDIRATSFCHQMVRSITGTMVDIGLGKRRAGDMRAVMRARDRALAGPVAPPDGLCLWEVGYPS